jgi:hypothetical protein
LIRNIGFIVPNRRFDKRYFYCSLLRTVGSIVLCSLFISCKSTPQISNPFIENEKFLPLDVCASVYLFANVQEARPFFEFLPIEELDNKHVKQMIDRTNTAVAAVFPKESERRFQLATWGNYPSSGAGMAFTFNKNWKRHRSEINGTYWHSARERLSLALSSRQAFVTGWNRSSPASPFAAGIEMPEGFNEFRRGAVLSCWVNNPSPIFQRMLSDAGIPIRLPVQQLFLKLNPVMAEQYEAVINLTFETPAYARTVAAILGLAGNFTSDDPGMEIIMLFLAGRPVQNGRNLEIKTAPMNESEILRIFNMFLF